MNLKKLITFNTGLDFILLSLTLSTVSTFLRSYSASIIAIQQPLILFGVALLFFSKKPKIIKFADKTTKDKVLFITRTVWAIAIFLSSAYLFFKIR